LEISRRGFSKELDLYMPETIDPEISELYQIVQVYLQRCEGKEPPLREFTYFTIDPYHLPVNREIYYALINRVRMIKKYNIQNKEGIKRLILTAFYQRVRIKPKELEFLKVIVDNPKKRPTQIAKILNVSKATAVRFYKRLREKFKLRFFWIPDVTIFKLKHFVYYFETKRDKLMMLRNTLSIPFLTTINIDTLSIGDEIRGWATFWIPNQQRILSEFNKWIIDIYRVPRLVNDWELYEILGMGSGSNLSLFDGREWVIDEGAWALGLPNFMRGFLEVLPEPKIHYYKQKSIKFDKIDWLIFDILGRDYKTPLKKVKEILSNFGSERHISDIYLRKRRLEKYLPCYASFGNLGLEESLFLMIDCDSDQKNLLIRVFSQFPMYWIAPHRDGLLVFIELPKGKSLSFAYLLDSMREEFYDLKIISRMGNLGINPKINLINYWNEKRQYWEVAKDMFVL